MEVWLFVVLSEGVSSIMWDYGRYQRRAEYVLNEGGRWFAGDRTCLR
jgi:hypothetical protein